MKSNGPGNPKSGAKAARRGRARRIALVACCLAAAHLALVLGVLLNPKWLTVAVNAGLRVAGLDAWVMEASIGLSPPRLVLAGLSVMAELPKGPVERLSARVERVSVLRMDESWRDWPGGWLIEADRPEVDVAVREVPGDAAGERGQELGAAPPLARVAVKASGGQVAVSWPGGRAGAEGLDASFEPGGSFSANARIHAETEVGKTGTSPDVHPGVPASDPLPPDGETITLSGWASVSLVGHADIQGRTVGAAFMVESGELGAFGASVPVTAEGEARIGPESAMLERMAVNLGHAFVPPDVLGRLPWAGELAASSGLVASLRGEYKEGAASLEIVQVHVPGVLLARANLSRDPEGNTTVETEGAVEDVAGLRPLWTAWLPREARDMELAGQVPFSVSLAFAAHGAPSLRAAVAAPSLLARSKALGVSVATALEASFDDGTLSGRLTVRGEVLRPDATLPGVEFETRIAGRAPTVLLEGVRFSCAPGRLAGGVAIPGIEGTGGAGFTADAAGLSGAAALDARIADAGTIGLRLKLVPGMPPVVESATAAFRLDRLAALMGLGGKPGTQADGVAARDGRAKAGARGAASGRASQLEPDGGAGSGKTGAAGKESAAAKPGAADGLTQAGISGRVEISLLPGGLSPGRPMGVEARLKDVRLDLPGQPGLASHLAGRGEAVLDPASPGTLKASLALTGGMIRLPTVDINLARLPLKLAASAVRAGDSVSLDASASFSGLAGGVLKGRFAPGSRGWTGQGEARLSVNDLAGCLQAFAPAAAVEHKVSARGKARLSVSYSGPLGSPSLTGRGEAEVAELRAGPLSASKLRVPVILERDLLRFHDEASPALNFAVLGGRLSLGAPEIRKPFSQDFEARLSAVLAGVALGPLTGNRIESEATARFEAITLTREMLSLDGELNAKAFGGDLIVKGVKVARPFVKDRQFRLHAGLLGADMLRLSALTGVGRITGRLNVTLSELHMAGFLPLAFTLRIESAGAPGGEQRISLGAVNSLTEVSAGRPVDVGLATRAALKLFGDFGYTKLGLMIGLKGSMCTIRGLHHEGGVEYILKRSGLTGVDVINANPENAMPFADLLVRIKKIMNKEMRPQVRMGLGHSHEAPKPGTGLGQGEKRPPGEPARPVKPEHNDSEGTP
jgi:hypothetical protein